jgi:ubiquinone/menaquinone biosynthesis C-methylase UbiE
MLEQSVPYYDEIYGDKDYETEARQVLRLVWQHRRSAGNALLDVACGTGSHLVYLQEHMTAIGLDINREMLAIAHRRCPGVEFYQGDMVDFDLGVQVDAVICLFSAIGYVKTVKRLQQTACNLARHLKPGGVLIVEPWFTPDKWYPGTVHATFVDQPDLKIARMTISKVQARISVNVMHYLVATPEGVKHFTERLEMGLFTHQEYLEAFRAAGLEVTHDPAGLTGRGLYIGVKPV